MVAPSPQQGSASSWEMPGACVMPSPPLTFPVSQSKGSPNMDVLNLATSSVSHGCRNGASGDGGTHGRRDRDPHAPDSPSWL